MSQLPNLLTLLRIAACPVLVLLLAERNYAAAMMLFIAAGVTDGLDGYIAKRYNFVSRLGAILDPIADKLLIACAYIMLAMLSDIPFWLLVVVMFRDLVIVGGYLVLVMMGDEVPMQPTYLSKVNTFLQISLVIAVLGANIGWLPASLSFVFSFALPLLIAGVVITTLGSGGQYVWAWGIKRPSAPR